MSFTPAQIEAIDSRGNTVVIAGAGTGKTRTLIERAMRHVVQEGVSLDEILMVTFTEAAAAEMRKRIRASLNEKSASNPADVRLAEQLALLDSAHICTLHSFCLKLVREHFYELELDPQLSVLTEEQSKLFATETLDEIFAGHYAGATPEAPSVLALLELQSRAKEQPVRELVMRIHEYTQTRPDPKGWFARQIAMFSRNEPEHWEDWLLEAVQLWAELGLPLLQEQPPENTTAHACAGLLKGLQGKVTRKTASELVGEILDWSEKWPPKKKGEFSKPLKGFFADAEFLSSLLPVEKADPLQEDWDWVKPHMLALLRLAEEFEREFSRRKRESAALDFHDLEQFCLRLLWDPVSNGRTPLAESCSRRIKLIFVDEYQDINEAQDQILTALAGEGTRGNRFLVGDIKQSIYGFRQAAPRIFQSYTERWRGKEAGGRGIFLSDNFRSHESLLEFINPLFEALMSAELGGVQFRKEEKLLFGNRENRAPFRLEKATDPPRVEVHLRFKQKDSEEEDEIEELSDAEKEARIVAERITTLLEGRTLIWDKATGTSRPIVPADIVILMRSPRGKVESYAKEFARAGLPLQASRTGFFDSIEVQDLMNLLQLLDNPLQDVPAIAVLHSPLAGLSLNELAEVRLRKQRHAPFWEALLACQAEGEGATLKKVTLEKVEGFLQRFARWRSMARHSSLLHRLETILKETSYLDWLLTQPRGEQRQANVHQLLGLAREFDELHHQGLYRFLQLLEAQSEAAGDREPAALESDDSIRLMSIHQSKGLEFPVVFVPDLGKRFNFKDATGKIILDEKYGICPMVRPPDTGSTYPSLPHWLASHRYRAEMLGEEIRILYVALTRAEQHLILTGTCTASTREKWAEHANKAPSPHSNLRATSVLEWLGPWWTKQDPQWLNESEGKNTLWRWRLHVDGEVLGDGARQALKSDEENELRFPAMSEEQFKLLKARLEWRYSHAAATLEPAKTTVTELRRHATEMEEESALLIPKPKFRVSTKPAESKREPETTGAERGVAHHLFLQKVSLSRVGTLGELRAEASRFIQTGVLSEQESSLLDFEAIHSFWCSRIGREILEQKDFLKRELAFSMRLAEEDTVETPFLKPIPKGEFVIIQGVADLAVLRPEEIWILDFKTDQVSEPELEERTAAYAPQLQLYGLALRRIYKKPVTHHWLYFLSCGKAIEIPAYGSTLTGQSY